MIPKSISLLALALAAAAVAAPIAQSNSAPKGYPLSGGTGFVNTATYPGNGGAKTDPLAVGYLIGKGLSPSEVSSWTTGACSHQVKAASCYAMLQRTAAPKPADPLAVGYLIGQGLSPSEVTSWTVGACSHQAKDAACYAMFRPAATGSTQVTGSTGFQWGDAGIGAGFTLGIILLLGGVGAGLLISRRNGRHQPARA